MRNILFLFAHQDDELSTLPEIYHQCSLGNHVYIFFLTSGTIDGSTSFIRNKESIDSLISLGVIVDNICFIGSDYHICDKQLVNSLEKTRTILYNKLHDIGKIEQIYSLAWEGGHPDHDATNLLAHDLTKNYPNLKNRQLYQFYFYNLYQSNHIVKTRLFISIHREIAVDCRFSFQDGFNFFKKLFVYKSQIMSMLWMIPYFIKQFIIKRQQYIYVADIRDIQTRPHLGKLCYEQNKFYSYDEFVRNSKEFIMKYLSTEND